MLMEKYIQDVSVADASFNNVDINDDLNVNGKSIFKDVSGADASFNNVDINDDLNVEGKSIFKDVSLNKIGTATTDVSNIVIDGNLTPSINEGYDLGSSSKAWRELWLSNNSIIFKQEGEDNKNDVISIGIDTTTDGDGSTNYTLELNVKGKDDSDNEPAKKIKLARGKVRQTTQNGVKTRKAETFLEDLSFNNVDICGNKLSAKNIYITGNIYQNGSLFSSTSSVNKIGQSFFDILTQQPSKFKSTDTFQDATSVSIEWSYEDIIANQTDTILAKLSFQSAANLQNLPHINEIQIDISGNIETGHPSNNQWLNYTTIPVTDNYLDNNNSYTIDKVINPQTNVENILSKTEFFDARVYGINHAEDYPIVEE